MRPLRLGPEPLAHPDRLVDAPASRREVEADRPPLLLEPAGADPELDPPTRQEVERLHSACRDERVAQPEVVHVRAEAHMAGSAGEEAEVRERVEHRCGGRHGWVLVARVGRAAHPHGQHEVLGEPHRLVPETLGFLSGVDVEVRVEGAERDAELHVLKLPSSARFHPPAARLPPSTWMVVPVTNRPRSPARYTAAAATSST